MTSQEITAALVAAGIPNPQCRYDDNGGRYRVTAETEINGRHESHSKLVYLYMTREKFDDVIAEFSEWHVALNGDQG